jgi:hypothetical protein
MTPSTGLSCAELQRFVEQTSSARADANSNAHADAPSVGNT